MKSQYILISYKPDKTNLGDSSPGALYDYLVNELNNDKIVCRIMEYGRDPRRAFSNNRMKRNIG